jgi:multiple sugar transport system ATP-binding protein
MLGIEPLLDRHPWQLSGGEKQRVALGRAIVRTPSVLLMDEPLSNLDLQLREQMRAEIAAIHRRLHTTTIYVTHDQVEAMTLGERIAVMDAGSIQQTGTPLEVYDRPTNRRVAGLLGSPPMNFIEGEVVASDNLSDGTGMRFVGGGLQVELVHEQAARLGDCVGRRVVLGVRPEHIRVLPGEGSRTRESSGARSLATSATSRGTSLAKIVMVETLGDSTILRLGLESGADQTLLTCKQAGRFSCDVNQRVRIDIEATECHVFDAEDGSNLTV